MRRLIKVDGTVKEMAHQVDMSEAMRMMGCELVDIVALRHMGEPLHVMLVDDLGIQRRKPVNNSATKLYWANCKPDTDHKIRGDVFVAPDSDFE